MQSAQLRAFTGVLCCAAAAPAVVGAGTAGAGADTVGTAGAGAATGAVLLCVLTAAAVVVGTALTGASGTAALLAGILPGSGGSGMADIANSLSCRSSD